MKPSFRFPLRVFIAAITIAFICIVTPANAFIKYPSIGIKNTWSANGFAAAPAITFRYSFEKTDLDFGVNFQLKGSHFCGYQANVITYASPYTRKIRLGFFMGVRYFYSASLKDIVAATEKWVQPESKLNFDELRMHCLEAHAGFGIRVHHSLRLNSFFGIGIGAYQTIGKTWIYAGMHRQVQQAELTLTYALSFSFR